MGSSSYSFPNWSKKGYKLNGDEPWIGTVYIRGVTVEPCRIPESLWESAIT